MNSGDALAGLISLVGAGGTTSIVIGFLAYKREAAAGRRDPMKAETLPTSGAFPGSHDIELLTNAVSMLAAGLNRLSAIVEHEAKDREVDDLVEERAERREMREVLRAWRSESGSAGR